MSDKTSIEWTDTTWNPVTGCTKVSPGCDHCYAETIATRFAGTPAFPKGFQVRLRPGKVNDPLNWRTPRRVFVNSMSDLFHDEIPDPWLTDIFAVMAAAPRHTFQVLTKRHARMRSLLTRSKFVAQVKDRAIGKGLPAGQWAWPLPHVWLGVSVENQQWADIRVPALLETPAAVRFLSCEPLLGPLDLTAWMPPTSPMQPSAAPKSWADWVWPGFVPIRVREQIQNFWSEDSGRGPRAWLANMSEQGAPPFGAVVTMGNGFGPNPAPVTGRYVHAWNNIGRLVLDDGEFAYTSFSAPEVCRLRNIDQVIVGGESGPNARPMHPRWARNLRDQCQAAHVAFFFKQWGEWAPRGAGIGMAQHNTGREVLIGDVLDDMGHRQIMRRVGKSRAGRELDGRTWDQYPQAVATAAS